MTTILNLLLYLATVVPTTGTLPGNSLAEPMFSLATEPVVVLDGAGIGPLCIEITGNSYEYASDCMLPVNTLVYFTSQRAEVRTGSTCSELGYERTGPDAMLNGTVHWKGGSSAMHEFVMNSTWAKGHREWPLMEVKLWAGTPACGATRQRLLDILANPLDFFPTWPGTPPGLATWAGPNS